MTLRAKLHKAMAEMPAPKKDKKAKIKTKSGAEFSYDYEDLAQVLAIVEPALRANGIELEQGITRYAQNDYSLETGVSDDDEFLLLDSRPVFFTAASQENASYETQMRRYALKTAFALAAEDDDGAQATKPKKPEYLQPLRDALPNYCTTLGITKEQAVQNILQTLGAKSMDEIAPDGVDYVLDLMQQQMAAVA